MLAVASAAAAPPQPSPEAYRSTGTITAWYELRLPPGPPRGIVLLFHGGAWRNVGPEQVRRVADYRGGELAREWRERGFITVVSTYSAGEGSWTDVVSVYDQLHARYPDLPIGAYGQSAGAHLSLLLGAARHLAFAVSDAGPTDWSTWRSAYPCFTRDCSVITPGFTGVGAYWVDVEIPSVFGAAGEPAPNMDDYDVAPNYGPASGPDAFLIYGRRYQPSDPERTQIADGTPADGVNANAYIDADNDLSTLDDELETDQLVTQQQGVILKDKIGERAILRTIPRGDSRVDSRVRRRGDSPGRSTARCSTGQRLAPPQRHPRPPRKRLSPCPKSPACCPDDTSCAPVTPRRQASASSRPVPGDRRSRPSGWISRRQAARARAPGRLAAKGWSCGRGRPRPRRSPIERQRR